jgi:aminoglycoside phosphotransferase (APT) family kinase protein
MPELALADLAARLKPVGVVDVRPLSGGASSLTYEGVRHGRRVVIKVAPPGVAAVRNRDVLRQARLLRALVPTPVPVPEVVWDDAGQPPDVPPLFVMSFVEGESLEPLFDLAGPAVDLHFVASRLSAAVRTMAALHHIHPAQVGLDDEAVVGPTEEVERWVALLRTVDPALVPGWQDAEVALRASVPSPQRPAIVHGDFRLGNLLATGDRIDAVLDWEIWSVGDPRVDVGWFLLNADPATYGRPTPYVAAVPPIDDLASLYAEAMGGAVPSLDWFVALASFKSAATWALIVKHNRRRSLPDPDVEALVPVLPRLLARARELAGDSWR